MAETVSLKLKVCLVGDSAVGKTSMIRRYVTDTFNDNYITTIGTKVSKKELKLNFGSKNVEIDMTVWDIMGSHSFRQLLAQSYFFGAQGILSVCDITREETLKSLDDWCDAVFQTTGKVPVVFAANKSDLKEGAKYGEKEMTATAEAFDGQFVFTSAKTGANVEEAFKILAKKITMKQLPSLSS